MVRAREDGGGLNRLDGFCSKIVAWDGSAGTAITKTSMTVNGKIMPEAQKKQLRTRLNNEKVC